MRSILGIDTAGRVGSVALAEDGAAVCWEILSPGMHSSVLSEAAGRLLRSRGIGLGDLAGIAVSGGPGSFTGLRIGLAWAKGVCFGRPVRLSLVSAHEANAHRHRRAGRCIGTVLPGERGEVQAAVWEGGPRANLLWGPDRISEDNLARALRAAAGERGPILVAGVDLRPDCRELLEEEGFAIMADAAARATVDAAQDATSPPPTAAAVAELGDRELLEGRATNPASAAPSYGRAPNARRPPGVIETKDIRIVPLAPEHLDEVIVVERASFTDPWTRGMFESELDVAARAYARAAIRAERLVGYLLAVVIPDEAHIGNLAVHPDARGQGIAQLMLDGLVRDARRAGVRRVTLEVRESNTPARKFYYKNDFIDVAIRKNYYRSPVEDAIVMYRVLPEDPSV